MNDMNIYKVNVKCHACGKTGPFVMHTLIDTAKDIHAESKIFSGEYFTYVCPICHQVQPISYSCMYHDGKRKLLIGFADSEKDYADMKIVLSGTEHKNQLDDVLSKWLEACEVRIVRSEYALQEKVLIAHFDLDDRIIEIARYLAKKELGCKDILYFNTKDDGYVFMENVDGVMQDVYTISQEMYDALAEKYKSILETQHCLEIDHKWAESVLNN